MPQLSPMSWVFYYLFFLGLVMCMVVLHFYQDVKFSGADGLSFKKGGLKWCW